MSVLRGLSRAALAIGALLMAACGDPGDPAQEPREADDSRAQRREAEAGRWLAADEEWPQPLPLIGVAGYALPEDENAWIERCISKLSRPLPLEALRYAKEMLGEQGPAAVAALGRIVGEQRGRRGEESLSLLLHAIGALAFHPSEQTWSFLIPVLDHASPLARREALRGLAGCREPALAAHLAERLAQDPALGRGRFLAGQILRELSRAAAGNGGASMAFAHHAYELGERREFHVDAGDDEMARYLALLVDSRQPVAAATMEALASSSARAPLHREIVERSVLLPNAEDALRILRRIQSDLRADDAERPLLMPLLRRALGMLGDAEALAHFQKLLAAEDARSRQLAVQSLGYAGQLEPALARLRDDPEATVRIAAASAISIALRRRAGLFPPDEPPREPLRGASTPELVAALARGLTDPHPMVREEVARTAALLGSEELFAPVLSQLRSDDPVVRHEALSLVVAPLVHWRPAAAVMLDELERLPPEKRVEWLQATVLLATPAEGPRLVALLEREDSWGNEPVGEVAARYVGDLGRDIAPLLVEVYRRARTAMARARLARVLMIALVGNSQTRRPEAVRHNAPLSEGARFLVEEVLEDPELPAALRFQILREAPRYGGRGVAPLLLRRYERLPLPPRERSWTLRTLWEYF
ncbi:MAG: HEAT repeat domain-containing protein [Planctomycetes bacterium]|nr:HEAT repeat domain-containing protein [Planctomycetota bacterium]